MTWMTCRLVRGRTVRWPTDKWSSSTRTRIPTPIPAVLAAACTWTPATTSARCPPTSWPPLRTLPPSRWAPSVPDPPPHRACTGNGSTHLWSEAVVRDRAAPQTRGTPTPPSRWADQCPWLRAPGWRPPPTIRPHPRPRPPPHMPPRCHTLRRLRLPLLEATSLATLEVAAMPAIGESIY